MLKSKRFNTAATIILTVLVIITLLPLALIVISSFTKESALIRNGYSFWPQEWSLDAYYYMIKQGAVILRSYGISVFVTVVGTAASVILTTMLAYPMSRKSFNLVTAFNVILVKNYYANNIPDSLIEAAEIDGATEMTIFRKIMLPLAVPTVATISLFTGLCYWNDWTNGLYYVSNEKLYSIQMLLMKIMNNIQALRSNSTAALLGTGSVDLPGTAIRMAMAVIGILPILLVYPFIQKYLVRGVVVGAVKG